MTDMTKSEAIDALGRWLRPNTELFFVATPHTSGRFRVLVSHDDRVLDITYHVGVATGFWSSRAREVSLTGHGYSKPYHVTCELESLLGFKLRHTL